MNIKKAILGGILIWLIMFAIISTVLSFYEKYFLVRVMIIIIAGLTSFIIASYLKPKNSKIALTYGLIFVVVGLILDVLITKQFNTEIFNQPALWGGYLLILLAPVLRLSKDGDKIEPVPKEK